MQVEEYNLNGPLQDHFTIFVLCEMRNIWGDFLLIFAPQHIATGHKHHLVLLFAS